ncbi:kinesin-like protein KIF14 [Crassostrea virginica]
MERGVNKGLLPRICESIFQRIEENDDQNIEYQVSFTLLEIYNEEVFDLLSKRSKGSKGPSLRVYDSKADGLQFFNVSDAAGVEKCLDEGYTNRSIAATKMNEYSSRAHTIATVYLRKVNSTEKKTLSSQMNIVDLAGSERAAKSQTDGRRLVEGNNINRSLLSLGMVIRALSKKEKANYRDSKLTMLLKDSIGGNSKTVMLATVNPSEEHVDETRSTLKYASEAKLITNRAKINKSQAFNDKEVEDLVERLHVTKEELKKIKKDKKELQEAIDILLQKKDKEDKSDLVAKLEREIEDLRNKEKEEKDAVINKLLKEIKELREQLNKTLTEKQNAAQEDSETVPYLLNLNEDHMLSKLVKLNVGQGQHISVVAGIQDDDARVIQVPIAINNPGKIARITNKEGKVSIETFFENIVTVNGERINVVKKCIVIENGYRLMLGSTQSLWVFVNPLSNISSIPLDDITYEMALEEIILESNTELTISPDEISLKRKVIKRSDDVKEANFKALLANKPLEFNLTLTSAYFLGESKDSLVVIVHVWDMKHSCGYILSEEEFMNKMDSIHAFQVNRDNDCDPFIIDTETFTPVGISFAKFLNQKEFGSRQEYKNPISDEDGKEIGRLSCSFHFLHTDKQNKSLDKALQEGKTVTVQIGISKILFDDQRKHKYWKVKCQFQLPRMSAEGIEMTCIETDIKEARSPVFNYEYIWKINVLTKEHIKFLKEPMIIRILCIPLRSQPIDIQRGDKVEFQKLLNSKDDQIKKLKEENKQLKKERDILIEQQKKAGQKTKR